MNEIIINNNPKVSFVVESYNYSKFIEETLDSIKKQTYENIEIIVVDDYSTDNSIEVIQNFINNNNDLNIKLIKHDKNYGQLKSILTGIESASGEFISFIDADDIIFENYTQNLLNTHLKNNVAFISCKSSEHDKNENKENITYKYINNKPFGGWFWYPITSAMFRKQSLDIILNYKNVEDWKICPDKFIFNLLNLLEGSIVVNLELFYKRQHENNAGNFNRTKLNIENNIKIRKLTLDFIKENNSNFIEKYGKNKIKKSVFKIYMSYFYIFVQTLKYVTKFFTSKIHGF